MKRDRDTLSFSDSASALDFCAKQDLKNVQILVRLGKNMRVVRIKVGEYPREFPARLAASRPQVAPAAGL